MLTEHPEVWRRLKKKVTWAIEDISRIGVLELIISVMQVDASLGCYCNVKAPYAMRHCVELQKCTQADKMADSLLFLAG